MDAVVNVVLVKLERPDYADELFVVARGVAVAVLHNVMAGEFIIGEPDEIFVPAHSGEQAAVVVDAFLPAVVDAEEMAYVKVVQIAHLVPCVFEIRIDLAGLAVVDLARPARGVRLDAEQVVEVLRHKRSAPAAFVNSLGYGERREYAGVAHILRCHRPYGFKKILPLGSRSRVGAHRRERDQHSEHDEQRRKYL